MRDLTDFFQQPLLLLDRNSSIDIASLRAGRNGDRIPVEGEIFHTRPDRPWGPPSLQLNSYWVSFPGVKRPGRGVKHPPLSTAEVQERVELYLYCPSGSEAKFTSLYLIPGWCHWQSRYLFLQNTVIPSQFRPSICTPPPPSSLTLVTQGLPHWTAWCNIRIYLFCDMWQIRSIKEGKFSSYLIRHQQGVK
jgi:hypothetical protein